MRPICLIIVNTIDPEGHALNHPADNRPPVAIVWFKRDLRVHDHQPLMNACQSGLSVIPLYVVETEYWQQPFASQRQWLFVRDCLESLSQQLQVMGNSLWVYQGQVTQILEQLNQVYSIKTVYAHEETGNDWTYQRDLQVAKYCQMRKITLLEFPSNGVVRRLKTRDHWQSIRDARMQEPITPAPKRLKPQQIHSKIPKLTQLDSINLSFPQPPQLSNQRGGHKAAMACLSSFLNNRSQGYLLHISSPRHSDHHCSRLSTHLTWGSLSSRQVAQALKNKLQDPTLTPSHRRSLTAFGSRLAWRCHFMQKLEDQPSLEYRCMHSGLETLRTPDSDNPKYLTAWQTGHTGYPFIDACMRCLIATGWITFRSRAMLVSFASYALWLDWRTTGEHLAYLFTDYEPGIHYSQLQMQSGTTGINTIRIYNPIKQSQDQDPDGQFIKRWIPELRHLDPAWIHTPWLQPPLLASQQASTIDQYPEPIVDFKQAIAEAKAKIKSSRTSFDYRNTAKQVYHRHGSRKNQKIISKKKPKDTPQGSLF